MITKYYFLVLFLFIIACADGNEIEGNPVSDPIIKIDIAPAELSLFSEGTTQNIIVTSNVQWTVSSDKDWCSCSLNIGYIGQTSLKISVMPNRQKQERTCVLSFKSGTYTKEYIVKQAKKEEPNYVPVGYNLVWSDDFDDKPNTDYTYPLPNKEWSFETGNHGWGNNEPQYYIDRVLDKDTVAKIKDGSLLITAFKLATPYQGSDYISARMNTVKAWKYGYFEMAAKLPGGRGTWAAFWMLPKNFQNWPLDGEIDIMEYVGYRPNVTQSSVHTDVYNHMIGTERTATKQIVNAETEFHIYALKWTEDEIIGYVDGEKYFEFKNDHKGNKQTWPFNEPFYLKLNLAIGGNWGGLQGIDASIFPVCYEIDYVRVYQKE